MQSCYLSTGSDDGGLLMCWVLCMICHGTSSTHGSLGGLGGLGSLEIHNNHQLPRSKARNPDDAMTADNAFPQAAISVRPARSACLSGTHSVSCHAVTSRLHRARQSRVRSMALCLAAGRVGAILWPGTGSADLLQRPSQGPCRLDRATEVLDARPAADGKLQLERRCGSAL